MNRGAAASTSPGTDAGHGSTPGSKASEDHSSDDLVCAAAPRKLSGPSLPPWRRAADTVGPSVYGHGSYFGGTVADPSDLDVMVITDEPDLTRERVAMETLPGLLPDSAFALPLDVSIYAPAEVHGNLYLRALAQHGRHLAGPDVVADLRPVHWLEWASIMAAIAVDTRESLPAAAALTALRALWAGQGRVVVPKHAVPAAAAGSRWGDLAAAAWQHRHASAFDWPQHELDELGTLATWSVAGTAASKPYEARGWSSRENAAAMFTVYRGALAPADVERLRLAGADDPRDGGWRRSSAPLVGDPTEVVLHTATVTANACWWRYPLAGFEPLDVHRHGVGAEFPAHVDRLPMFPTRAFNVVAMIQPADAGGHLFLNYGGELIKPDLDPGDVVVFDSSALHGVTHVEAGERVVLVTHAHMQRSVSAR